MKFLFAIFLLAALLAGCAAPAGAPASNPPLATLPPASSPPANLPLATETLAPLAPVETPAVVVTEPAPAASEWVAYIGLDGNIWLARVETGEQVQLTQDAVPLQGNQGGVEYRNPRWSSDGRMLAYQRQVYQPHAEGMNYSAGLWVYNTDSGVASELLRDDAAGYAWRPGTHTLAYARMVDPNYFTGRGTNNADAARGIWAIDAGAGGEPYELVPPENGRSLVMPVWSRSGARLGFDEVQHMEGRGPFAYYDLETRQYTSLERPIGGYDWLPDGQGVVFDLLTYVPRGDEDIRFLDLASGEEQPLLPELEVGYAYNPVLSPDGSLVAYLEARPTGPEMMVPGSLVVQPVSGGEPRRLGVFEYLDGLAWSPDGQHLLLSSGTYETRQVISVALADGSIRVLASGWQAAWRP